MTFSLKFLVVVRIHSSFDFNLLVANSLRSCFTIETDSLFLITYCFNTAGVKFLQGSWNLDFHCWHWWQLWFIHSTMGRAKETSFYFSSASVTDIVERIIFQEVTIKYLIAVLLIDVSTMMGPFIVFHTCTKYVFSILVINCFPLSYMIK